MLLKNTTAGASPVNMTRWTIYWVKLLNWPLKRHPSPHSHHASSSQAVKNTSRSKEDTDRQDRAGYFWYETVMCDWQHWQHSNVVFLLKNQTINNVLWLFHVPYQIAVAHMNRLSFHIYLKHKINMNEHQKAEICQYTPFFKLKSSDVNLLSSLVCLSDNMADSTSWLVRSQSSSRRRVN